MSRILDERDMRTISKDLTSLNENMVEKDTLITNNLNNHTNNTSNPHNVTYSQVGADPTGSASKALSDAKKYTDTKLTALVDSAPTTLDTLNELAAALNDDSNFAATMTTELGKKTNNTDFTAHTSNVSNPHEVTKIQVGLGNVPNVATNDQTPTYTEASTLSTLVSGEKLSVSLGKIMKAITDLISHIANKSNPHNVTKSQVGLGNADNTSDINKPVSTAQQTAIDAVATNATTALNNHIADKANPHSVTAAQVGLGNVNNTSDVNKPVSTAQNTAILNAKAEVQNNLTAHMENVNNPHSVTAHQVGAYTQAETDAKISALVDSAPETLDTLNELAVALGEDPNFATTMATELGKKTTKDEFNIHKEDTNNPHNVTVSQIGADALGSAAQALTDAKKYTDSKISTIESNVEFELETNRTLFDDRISMLENRVALPTISAEDEGKVLCVVNGAYTLVSITDLIPNEEEPVS